MTAISASKTNVYRVRKAAGICPGCAGTPAPGHHYCTACLIRMREYARTSKADAVRNAQFMREGRCRDCSTVKPSVARSIGATPRCDDCRAVLAIKGRARPRRPYQPTGRPRGRPRKDGTPPRQRDDRSSEPKKSHERPRIY